MFRSAIFGSILPPAAILMACTSPTTDASKALSEPQACDAVKSSVQSRAGGPIPKATTCDFLEPADSPKGYYVLALHSNRVCDGICSDNMGWFAVDRAKGDLFEWDVGEDRLGPPIAQ
jgi:hypothetical protein